jgi:hypothetical protein
LGLALLVSGGGAQGHATAMTTLRLGQNLALIDHLRRQIRCRGRR